MIVREAGPFVKNGLMASRDPRTMTARKVRERNAVTRKQTAAKKTASVKKKTKTGDSALCAKCIPAKCCMYFSTEIDAPGNAKDFDDVLWMIAHRDVEIYTKRRRWYLMVRTPCRFYDPSRGCLIYPSRPRICRQHHTDGCEFDDDYAFDRHFRSYEELERYARRRLPKRATRSRRSA
jgi:Fe-S-cluster containining protein